MIQTLIDKQDNFEIVRDQIAGVLANEVASQMALATAAAKDPEDWRLRIYAERANPWEPWLNSQTDPTPIVNVWFDTGSFKESGSNVMQRQLCEATYNIDCYAYGSSAAEGSGHVAGDKAAALAAHKAGRLVRNIMMASEYTYLGLRGLVSRRWTSAVTAFQPQSGNQPAQNVIAVRVALLAQFSEFSPQYQPETLEYVSVEIKREEDGEIVAQADYDYTT